MGSRNRPVGLGQEVPIRIEGLGELAEEELLVGRIVGAGGDGPGHPAPAPPAADADSIPIRVVGIGQMAEWALPARR